MIRTTFSAAFAAVLVLAGCASHMSRTERLSLYEANASEPRMLLARPGQGKPHGR